MKDNSPLVVIAILAIAAGMTLYYQYYNLLKWLFGLGIAYALYKVIAK